MRARRYRRETSGRARERKKESGRLGGRERGRHRKEGVGTEIDAGALVHKPRERRAQPSKTMHGKDARETHLSHRSFFPRHDSSFSARRLTTVEGQPL